MEKRDSQLEHGVPMEQTGDMFCTCDSGIANFIPSFPDMFQLALSSPD